MGSMTRRGFLALVVLGVAALAPGGCGGDKPQSIKVVIAEYSKDHTRPFWQALADQYTKQTGVKVDLQVIDWNSIDQQVSTMLQNNQPPDILNLNAFASYAKDGLLYSAEEILSPKTREDFLDAFVRGGEYRGKLYGFPILSSARAFFYNRDLLAKAGLAGPPRTWDELVQAAKRVQALGDGTIGYALPLGPEEAQAEWSIWMWNNGGDWKAGEAWAIDSEQNVQALQFLADLANRHKVTQVNPGKTNRTDGAFQLFKDGKVGMVMGFSPLAAQLDAEGKVDYGVAQMPTNIGNAGHPGRRGLPDGLQEEGQPGRGEEVPRPLLPAGAHHPLDRRRGVPARDEVGPRRMSGNAKLKPYLDALPNARLAPTTDPAWDKVKLDVQQSIGAGRAAGRRPEAGARRLQKNAAASAR